MVSPDALRRFGCRERRLNQEVLFADFSCDRNLGNLFQRFADVSTIRKSPRFGTTL